MMQEVIDGMNDLPVPSRPEDSRSPAAATRSGDTFHTSAQTVNERRFGARYCVARNMIIIPVLPDGQPDWRRHALGSCVNVSPDGMGMNFPVGEYRIGQPLVVGVPDATGVMAYTGVDLRFAADSAAGQSLLGGRFGGLGQTLLTAENLMPRFHAPKLGFSFAFPEDVLQAWKEVGVLTEHEGDRVLLCPRCRSLPTFRRGCGNCGSAGVQSDQLMHHFACAHVDFVHAFERDGELVCPKCQTRHLIVGADFDYQQGEFHCPACNWADTELEQVGQCLCCGLRFPERQAVEEKLRGYHAHRLDPLALREAS